MKRPHTSTVVWMVLIILTCISLLLEEWTIAASIIASLVMVIAFFKVRLIFINFMELHWEVKPYRILFEVWAVLAVLIILGGYWYSVLMVDPVTTEGILVSYPG